MNVKAIEEQAEILLVQAGSTSIPFSPILCASYLGIKLSPLFLEEEISGFLAVNGKNVQIGYNQSQKPVRERFTIAHEIGHYILHSHLMPLFIDKNEPDQWKVLFRDGSSSTGEHYKEREANCFAAALLMPKNAIDQEIQKYHGIDNIHDVIADMAKRFQVSKQAMEIRLTRLGYLDYENLDQ